MIRSASFTQKAGSELDIVEALGVCSGDRSERNPWLNQTKWWGNDGVIKGG
jgi:hypothetical protein